VATRTDLAAPLRDPASLEADCVVGSAGSLAQPFRRVRTDATRNLDVTGGFSPARRNPDATERIIWLAE